MSCFAELGVPDIEITNREGLPRQSPPQFLSWTTMRVCLSTRHRAQGRHNVQQTPKRRDDILLRSSPLHLLSHIFSVLPKKMDPIL